MKYYFTIVAAGFSYIGFTLKLSYDKALEKDPCLYKRGKNTVTFSDGQKAGDSEGKKLSLLKSAFGLKSRLRRLRL